MATLSGSNYLAVPAERSDLSSLAHSYASFAKVGTGFKLEDYQWIQENTRDKATGRNFFFDFNRKKLPSFFSTVNEYPDQLIAPQE